MLNLSIHLEPCMDAEDLIDFEAAHTLRFPADYRLYLLKVGNGIGIGGAACSEGVLQFGRTPFAYPLAFSDLVNVLHKPFPYDDIKMMADDQEARTVNRNSMMYSHDMSSYYDEEAASLLRLVQARQRNVGGYITLGTSLNSHEHFWILICEGNCRGEVWIVTWHGNFYPCTPRMTFKDWLIDWIDCGGHKSERSLINTHGYPNSSTTLHSEDDLNEQEAPYQQDEVQLVDEPVYRSQLWADQTQSQQMLPIWAIVIIVAVVIALIAMAVFCMKKRRSRSLSVDTIHRKEDEKKSMSTSSFQTLVTQKQKTLNPKSETSSSSITASLPQSLLPAVPSPAQASTATAKKATATTTTSAAATPQSNEKTDKPASDHHESDYTPPEPPQEIKISLPLPPPSTSFFSDKMELDGDDAQDFYAMYLNSKSKQDNSFISIDLDMPSFYSNVQQKAATIKSTLRQSLRVKQKSNRNSVLQLFSDEQHSSSKKSGEDTTVIVPLKQDYPKVVIDMDPPTLTSTPLPPPAVAAPVQSERQDINIITQSTTNPSFKSDADESPITPNPNLQEPVRAAKRVIRTASRKTKTRSMVVTDTTNPTEDNDENGNGKRSKHGSIRYASIRGPKSNGEHMTITSGSMRRLVRESILFDDDALPLPSSAAIASSSSSNAAASSSIAATAPSAAKKSVVDIAGWWDTPKTSANTNSKPAVVAATTEHVNENHLPLNITSGLDSTSSNTPNQYRASLSASIFAGTLSKASGSSASLFSDLKEETANQSNGGVSRHGSFRRGTLGRNTLRSITATATNGVNRSLKGLFDYSSSTSLSNKVVPDDSQKMELDSEPVMSTAESTAEDNVPPPPLNVTRQKSVRAPASSSSSNRPTPPASYLKTSESSTKYALADDEDADDKDESSQKTALDDMAHPESPTLPKGHYDLPSGSNKIETAPLSIEKSAQSNFAQDSTPNSPMSSFTTHKGEVDTIRRMLQDTWITNMKESASNYSMLSEADSVATTSTQSTVSSKLAPRQQQSLLSKSLLTQQVAKRASLARHNGEEEFVPQQGPEPSASFSSSTVRTMVPANESAACGSLSSEPVAIRQNAISSKTHGSNKIQESSYDDKSHLMSRFSTSPMTDTSAVSSPRNSSADSSRGHSRKSSGGNSAATALRISSGYSANAKTWNGRAQKRANKPTVTQQDFVSPDDSLGRSSVNKKFFSTMRKGQKTRGNIPWMVEEDPSQEKTPAQIERDRYLEGGSIL
ncbi:hypothetical protein MAM1_0067d04033 [Mucor ambiguus]|uniref:Knr4/Smi1-like domain-containing protein n=1 Tax=Mucor ambiguus TaxID=91626 RepID=A0A0C9MN01_9FUNG|nr:hypothetical protein MAM1_0067d04033 [Mucor ambiguus]